MGLLKAKRFKEKYEGKLDFHKDREGGGVLEKIPSVESVCVCVCVGGGGVWISHIKI